VLRTCIDTLVKPEQWKRKLDSVQGMLGACIGQAHLQQQKMDLQEVGWVGMDWIDLAEDRDR